MNTFIKNILTGRDNSTFDVGRVLWVLGSLVYLGLSILSVIQGQQFNQMEFGTGLSAILAGGGCGIALKSHTEPECRGNDG